MAPLSFLYEILLQSVSQICNKVGARHGFRVEDMEKKVFYETPVVEVLEARVEKGFAGSNLPAMPEQTTGTEQMVVGQNFIFN